MKDQDMQWVKDLARDSARRMVYDHEHAKHVDVIHVFDCPNCGRKTAATEIKDETSVLGHYVAFCGSPMWTDKEYHVRTLCLVCGKRFEKKDKWEEVK